MRQQELAGVLVRPDQRSPERIALRGRIVRNRIIAPTTPSTVFTSVAASPKDETSSRYTQAGRAGYAVTCQPGRAS
jgi:hypothetical protein